MTTDDHGRSSESQFKPQKHSTTYSFQLEQPNEFFSSLPLELKLLAGLALQTALLLLGLLIPSFVVASHVGRNFGPVHLDAFQLANVIGNLFTLALVQGVLRASDTLGPQAYGAGNFRQIGIVAVRGYVVSMVLVAPVCLVLLLFLQDGLVSIGVDAEVSHHAYEWYKIYALSLPFYVLFSVVWKFLSAQSIMMPLLLASVGSCAVIFPASLYLGTRWFGFLGSAVAVVAFHVSLALSVLLCVALQRPHRPETWPGLSTACRQEVFRREPLKYYIYLGIGGMIASSEWIYWETLSLFIGTLGVIPLSVHAIPTQVYTVWFQIPVGLGIALAVRLAGTLPRNPTLGKRLAVVTLAGGTVFCGLISGLFYMFRYQIYRVFIDDPEVFEGCDQIWISVCLFIWQLSVFGINTGVALGLGMQWMLGVVTFFFLWVLGLPVALYIGVVLAKSLDVVWTLICPPYMCINAVLWIVFYYKDWDAVAEEIRVREGTTVMVDATPVGADEEPDC